MAYWKLIDAGYVVAVGTGAGNTKITEAEYSAILAVIHEKPSAVGTTDYRLREDLTWEAYEVEPPEADPDVDDAEALNILLGGAT